MSRLTILSGGAAQGLVSALAETFKAQTGLEIEGEFGAVGVMADRLRQGARADLVILTAALASQLAGDGLVIASSLADVGRVETALAVRTSDANVKPQDVAELRELLLASDAIFVPDTKASTAGSHVARVLRELGIAEQVANRLRIFPNGATAMRELARSDARLPLGCTQATEIIATEGVLVCGALPRPFELATMYTAGVSATATNSAAALAFSALLGSPEHRELRRRTGFAE